MAVDYPEFDRKTFGRFICQSKRAYKRRHDAWEASLTVYIEKGQLLGVYTCQYCMKYHLTRKFNGVGMPDRWKRKFNNWFGREVYETH